MSHSNDRDYVSHENGQYYDENNDEWVDEEDILSGKDKSSDDEDNDVDLFGHLSSSEIDDILDQMLAEGENDDK